jgi:preprotein translocase subunit SecD
LVEFYDTNKIAKKIRKLVRKFSVSRYALILVLLSLLPAQADGPSEASGGVYFIMAPRINEAHEAYFDILWPKVRDTLRASRDIVGTVRREKRLNGNLYVQISDPDGARHAWEKVSDLLAAESELLNFSNVKFDVSIENTLLTITFQEATSGQISEQIISQTIEVLRDRMVEFEISDVQVTAYGS